MKYNDTTTLWRDDAACLPAMSYSRWRRGLADLAIACAGSYAEDEGDRVREAADLLGAAPSGLFISGLIAPRPAEIDRMLGVGAGLGAALAMFDDSSAYMLSRGTAGEHLATVMLPGLDGDVTASGDTLALALLGALALALAEALPDSQDQWALPPGSYSLN